MRGGKHAERTPYLDYICAWSNTHDEFEYIPTINYESPVSLAMHQYRIGKPSNTVP